MQIRADLILPGAKLMAMTQCNYQKAKDLRVICLRSEDRKMVRNMELAKGVADSANGETPPSSTIWSSTKHKDIPRNTRFFLWMLLHDGYKVGDHWKKIEGFEERGECQACGVTETMDHILTK
ncbi:hypothetical protein B0H10DRAFT_2304214 [Mycena sp. CBHHK59/15]|nr:hypothetical protein B0H10DRAFT_2304214 [Mycena sp. CBHHK59/15]